MTVERGGAVRTFLAADLDDGFLDEMAALGESLRGRFASRASWVPREALHLTLRFFGATDEALVEPLGELTRTLAAGRPRPPVRALRVSAFPSPRRARVLVVSLASDALVAAAAEAERAAVALGFAAEERAYHPHLTLARLKQPEDVRALVAEPELGALGRATGLTLYESELGRGPGGRARYTPLARATFESGEGPITPR